MPLTCTLRVPLFKVEIKEIWEEQQKHVPSLQDPPGLSLYTVTGYLQKGGISLTSVALCSRHNFVGILPPPPSKVHSR